MGVCSESNRKRKNDQDTKTSTINTNNDKTSKPLSPRSSQNIVTKPSVNQKALISK